MSTAEEEAISAEEFQVLVQRAGLDLSPEEMERLRPLYQQLLEHVSELHDPSLPLGEPAITFSPDWSNL